MDKEEYFKELGRKKIKEFDFYQPQQSECTDLPLLIRYCPDLESIELPMQITPEQVSLLKNFKNLSSVAIEDAFGLPDEFFEEILALPHLKTLDIFNKKIDEDFCEKLIRCEQLTSLNLSSCDYLGDEDLQTLTHLKNLERLDVYGAESITDEGIKSVTLFPKLVDLVIGGCKRLTNEAMKPVAKLNKLEALTLAGTLIDQEGFRHLESLTKLKVLNVRSCNGLDDMGMLSLRHFKNLTQFALSHCWKVTEDGFSYLPEFVHLTHLDVSYTKISDKNLLALSGLPALGSLSLGSCDCLTAAGFDNIDQIEGLIDFELHNCDAVDDSVLKRIALIPSLSTLDLSGCNKITDIGLDYLSNHPRLCHLKLKHCDQITKKGLFGLAERLPDLSLIFISYCKNISAFEIEEFKKTYPNIRIFS